MKARLLTSLILSSVVQSSSALSGSNDCSACKNVVDTFLYGMSQTKKAHFGGGNTAWEEQRLGKYQNSEIRYHDVVDFVCKSYDSLKLEKDDERKCHDFMADHEEDLETWYFHKQNQAPDLKLWFCIEKTRTCCPDNQWGPECQPCPGDAQRPCFSRGKCDGEGTRKGTGKCKCDKGYQGNLCRKCSTNYFDSLQNETHITCDECDKSCKGGCSGPESKNCLSDCKPGWKFVQNEGCVDVDECLENPCKKDHEICTNNVGGFVCSCKDGYKKENGICVIDVTDDDDEDENDEEVKTNETNVDESKVQNSDQKTASENIDISNDKPGEEEPKIPIMQESNENEPPKKEQDQKFDTQKEESSLKKSKMSDEHRRKVREHLKQVMETIENLGKKDQSAEQRKNQFRYPDPNIQSVIDELKSTDGVKRKSFDSTRKVEL